MSAGRQVGAYRRPHVRPVVASCRAAQPIQTRIVISEPLSQYDEDVPDCYAKYKDWSDELERDIRRICKRQLDFLPPQTAKFLRIASENCGSVGIFLHPGRLNSRIHNLRSLDQQFPGFDATALLDSNAFVLSQTSQQVHQKLLFLQQLFGEDVSTEELTKAVCKCAALLTRSSQTIEGVHRFLTQLVGAPVAANAIKRYPYLFSRSLSTIQDAHDVLLDCLKGDRVALEKVIRSNCGVLVRQKTLVPKFQALERLLDTDRARVIAVVTAVPTILNLSEKNIAIKVAVLEPALPAWGLTLHDWTASNLAVSLTASRTVLLRLEYVAFTGSTKRSPLYIVQLSRKRFDELYPTFLRWLRRKHPAEHAKLSIGAATI